MTQCDLSDCGSFSEIINKMKEFAEKRKKKEGTWIIGCNYDQNFLEEKKHPDRYVLDQISENSPGPSDPCVFTYGSSQQQRIRNVSDR